MGWVRRQNQAFWRGRLIEPGKPCMKEKCVRDPNLCAGNLARFEGLSLTLRHPELFVVKALHISPSWTDKAALRNRSCLPTSFATKIAKRLHKVTEPKHRPHNYYARFKMNLHFPGSTTGSYSRNLNHLWSTDAVVLIWKHAAVEHYYRGLAHGVTHLDVDLACCGDGARSPEEPTPRGEAESRCSGSCSGPHLPGVFGKIPGGCTRENTRATRSKLNSRRRGIAARRAPRRQLLGPRRVPASASNPRRHAARSAQGDRAAR